MARTPEQRGPFGRWLVRERKARGWTADEMRVRLQEARGFAMAHSTYALLESGQRQPTDEQVRHLSAFLGSEPEKAQPVTASSDIDRLVEVVRQQQASIDALRGLVETLLAEVRPKPVGGAAVRLPVPDDTFEESPLTEAGRDAAELAHGEMTGAAEAGPVAGPQLRSVPRTPSGRTRR